MAPSKQARPLSTSQAAALLNNQASRPAGQPNGRAELRTGFFGIDGLDDILPGGITYDTQIMTEGDTGIGKSVLAAQFLYEGLMVGDTCIYIACDEPPSLMRQNMNNFRLGTESHERAGKLVFVDAYARGRSKEEHFIEEPDNFDEFFLYEKRVIEAAGSGPVRLMVDSLSTIMATAETPELIAFNSNRLRYLRARNVLTLDTVVSGVLEERAMNGLRHAYPMIVYMRYSSIEGMTQRYIQLGKLKSGMFQATQHLFSIDPRTGIIVQKTRT